MKKLLYLIPFFATLLCSSAVEATSVEVINSTKNPVNITGTVSGSFSAAASTSTVPIGFVSGTSTLTVSGTNPLPISGSIAVSASTGPVATGFLVGTSTQTVSATNPLPVSGSFSFTPPAITTVTFNGASQPITSTQTYVFHSDSAPATGNITVHDTGSTSASGANGVTFFTGTPTAGSISSFAVASMETGKLMISGSWTGTLSFELSLDGGTTWIGQGVHQTGTVYTVASTTANFVGGLNLSGATNFRVRATAAMTGTAVIRSIFSLNPNSFYLANSPSIVDGTGTTSKWAIGSDGSGKVSGSQSASFGSSPPTIGIGAISYLMAITTNNVFGPLYSEGNQNDAEPVISSGIISTEGHDMMFNGTSWDRFRGDTSLGLWVNLKSSPTVTFNGIGMPVTSTSTVLFLGGSAVSNTNLFPVADVVVTSSALQSALANGTTTSPTVDTIRRLIVGGIPFALTITTSAANFAVNTTETVLFSSPTAPNRNHLCGCTFNNTSATTVNFKIFTTSSTLSTVPYLPIQAPAVGSGTGGFWNTCEHDAYTGTAGAQLTYKADATATSVFGYCQAYVAP